METRQGNGIVRKVGEKPLRVVEGADGKPSAESEGYFTYSYSRLATIEEVLSHFAEKKNQLVVTNDAGDRVSLPAEDSITELVNRELEREAKANAYQRTVAKFKPAEDPQAAFDKIVRTFMSLGLPEDMAIQHAKDAIEANRLREESAVDSTVGV